MTGRAVALVLVLCVPAMAGDGDGQRVPRQRVTDPPAPVSTQTWRNPTLERTHKIVLEVIERVRSLHVDGESFSADRMREDAIEAFREFVAARSFRLLDGEARERFRRALQHVPDGDLGACFAAIDAHVALRTPEQANAVLDVLVRGAISAAQDPYTQVLDTPAVERLAASISGKPPAGYGIRLAQAEFGAFTIDHVSRGYDAFEKGIQDGDTIVEVNGLPTVLSSRDDIIRHLQADPKVTLRIWRDGFARGHDVELEARIPRGPNVEGDMLPGGIGYARLESFREPTAGELRSVLARLDRQGLRAFILDLRDDPGGSLGSCAAVAGLFLGPRKVVSRMTVREKGELTTKTCLSEGEAAISTRTPLLVLVNRGSASASEMLAGALRDSGRARILGSRTYGKGLGQDAFPIMSSMGSAVGDRYLLVSTMRFRSPAGRTPDRDGIEPDAGLVVPRFAYTAAEQEELLRLHQQAAFERYLGDHAVQEESILLELATDDEGKPERWPGFEAWRKSLATTLEPKVLRRALRAAVRAWAVRNKARAYHDDLEDDAPLRRAFDVLTAEAHVVTPPPSKPPAPEPPKATPRKYY